MRAPSTLIVGLLAALLIASSSATVFFKETFDQNWQDRWVQSTARDDYGQFELSTGKWFGDAEDALGLKTSQNARFYAISSKVEEPFSTEGRDFVLQFSVKHDQDLDCGGGYIKVLPASVDLKAFNGESPYYVMFGPDVCGSSNRRVHVIINYKGENHLIKTTIQPKTDQLTHVYTLVIRPDQTYSVLIDQKEVSKGKLVENWDFLAPAMIKDPAASKPEDWDDNPKIVDPEDVKPEGWDDIPATIPDPEASKPEDWDDDLDGDWEAPEIPNPEYKGEWTPRLIDNPNYKGVWVHPEIENPDYVYDEKIYVFPEVGAIGIDLWQVRAGSVFDNIIMTDSLEEAAAFYAATTGANIDAETAAKKKFDDEEKARRDAEAAARAAAEEENLVEDSFDDFEDHDEL